MHLCNIFNLRFSLKNKDFKYKPNVTDFFKNRNGLRLIPLFFMWLSPIKDLLNTELICDASKAFEKAFWETRRRVSIFQQGLFHDLTHVSLRETWNLRVTAWWLVALRMGFESHLCRATQGLNTNYGPCLKPLFNPPPRVTNRWIPFPLPPVSRSTFEKRIFAEFRCRSNGLPL